MRGKPPRSYLVVDINGLIPAYAGKTSWPLSKNLSSGAHPRVCGENSIVSEPSWAKLGSSPRMRGKHRRAHLSRREAGLIPAYAGKTHGRIEGVDVDGAHPRVCGENRSFDVLSIGRMGSSPRMRGKRTETVAEEGSAGLIPAYAGKTDSSCYTSTQRRAHPRVCGENIVACVFNTGTTGSSPRMRGKHTTDLPAEGMTGLIPAYAGKTGCE